MKTILASGSEAHNFTGKITNADRTNSIVNNVDSNCANNNLSSTEKLKKLAKSRNLNWAKSKKCDLAKAKAKDFANFNLSEMDFVISKAKNAFIHL